MRRDVGIVMAGNSIGAMKRLAARAGISLREFQMRTTSGEKYCWRCRCLHPREAFNADSTRIDGLDPACRESRSRHARDMYERRPRVSRLGSLYAPTRDGDKRQARARVNHRVDVGLLPDPNSLPCCDCGHVFVAEGKRHEYDHFLGYGAMHQLSVEAVCSSCHHKRESSRG